MPIESHWFHPPASPGKQFGAAWISLHRQNLGLGSHKMVRWFKTFCKMLHPEHVSDPICSLHQPSMFHVRWKKSEGSWVADHLLHARCQDTFEFFPSRPRSHGKHMDMDSTSGQSLQRPWILQVTHSWSRKSFSGSVYFFYLKWLGLFNLDWRSNRNWSLI